MKFKLPPGAFPLDEPGCRATHCELHHVEIRPRESAYKFDLIVPWFKYDYVRTIGKRKYIETTVRPGAPVSVRDGKGQPTLVAVVCDVMRHAQGDLERLVSEKRAG